MKPPTMMVAPFGIIATASSAETDLMLKTPVFVQAMAAWARNLDRQGSQALICIKGSYVRQVMAGHRLVA